MTLSRWQRLAPWIAVILLCAIALGLFAYTVHLREPWFGVCNASPTFWATSQTLLFARHWFREGPFALRFGMFWNPASVEYPTAASRSLYISYPPGAVVPLYLMACILGREPSLPMAMACDLGVQLLVAVSLAFIVFRFVRRRGGTLLDALLLAVVPLLVAFCLPGPAYFFQSFYVVDSAALLPYALLVLLEAERDHSSDPARTRRFSALQSLVMLWGISTDWLFILVVLCLFFKRAVQGTNVQRGTAAPISWIRAIAWDAVTLWGPVVVVLLLFALQLYHFDQFATLIQRFQERTGMARGQFLSLSKGNAMFDRHVISSYGVMGRNLLLIGAAGLIAVLLVAAFYRVRRRHTGEALRDGLTLGWLFLAPCALHFILLKQHSTHPLHSFSSLKFVLALATWPLVVLPVLLTSLGRNGLATFSPGALWARLRKTNPKRGLCVSLISPLLLAVAFVYVCGQLPHIPQMFPPPLENDPVAFGAFLQANTDYGDVVFSNDPTLITTLTYMDVAYSMKCIHAADTLEAVCEKVAPIGENYSVGFVIRGESVSMANRGLLELMAAAEWCGTFNGIRLYKTPGVRVQELCPKHGVRQ